MTTVAKPHRAAHFERMNQLSAFWGVAAALAIAACAPKESDESGDSITIGLLLPFTGVSAGTAANFEHSVIFATNRVNEGGGVRNKTLRIAARDTHSSRAQSIRSVRELVEDEGAIAILGPESPEIAVGLLPELQKHEVPLVSPLIGSAGNVDMDCNYPWYRLSPPAEVQGAALAKLAIAEGVRDVAVLYGEGEFSTAFRVDLVKRFATLGGTVKVERRLSTAASSYATDVEAALAVEPDAIFLVADPQQGALLVNEADALGTKGVRWFLNPLLKTDLFIQNIRARFLEGAMGVAPKIFDTGNDFPDAFGQRWSNERPLEGAYFYFDALAMLSLAIQSAPSLKYADLKPAIAAAAAPPGEAAGWNKIDYALEHLRKKDDMYYSGLTGPLLLDKCGPRKLGVTMTWSIRSGKIENKVDDE